MLVMVTFVILMGDLEWEKYLALPLLLPQAVKLLQLERKAQKKLFALLPLYGSYLKGRPFLA